jgi:CobQ-like glutamine amidotransferase family enzyme
MSAPSLAGERLVVAHLFPELLNLYGDLGNVNVLARRGEWRGLKVEVRPVGAGDDPPLDDVDLVFIGGGPDRDQVAVAKALGRLGPTLVEAVGRGTALLAVCGGYQNLGHVYRSELVGELAGPGLLDVSTDAPSNADRMVGGVVLRLPDGSPIAALGGPSAAAAGHPEAGGQITGFENHSGRTHLGAGAQPLGTVVVGYGNAGDGAEGVIAQPGEGGLGGLRIGTYLHGPLLPRNPHFADYLILSALRRHGVTELPSLDDRAEWDAHVSFAEHWRTVRRPTRSRSPIRRALHALDDLRGPAR